MSKRIRFGIVGCGMIGALHVRALRKVATAEVVAVADAIPDYARSFSEKYHVDWCPSYEALLARDDIDAVSICTPSGMHADQGILAAEAGKHVLCEKPIDLYVERVDRLVAACREHGVTLGGIFQNRFPKAMRQVKQAIADGWLGRVVFAEASCLWYRPQSYYDSSAWRGTWHIDGGALANQGIHTIDRLIWLTGMQPTVLAAYCPTLQRTMEAEDLGIALLAFPNGAGGVIHGTTLADPGFPATVTICGDKGSVVIQHNIVTAFHAEGAPDGLVEVGTVDSSGGASDPGAIPDEDHAANFAEFTEAILAGRTPPIDGEEARKAVVLLNDIYRKAAVGPWAPVNA